MGNETSKGGPELSPQTSSLDLSNQKLAAIPPNLRKLAVLVSLSLNHNLIQDVSGLQENKRLQEVDLSNNQLETLVESFFQLLDLVKLNISFNRLVELSPSVASLQQLTELNLANNKLTTLPPTLAKLPRLNILNVSFNNLTTLPREIGGIISLTKLLLNNNQISDIIPEMGRLTNLVLLNLGENNLQALPIEIGGLVSLNKLYLDNNNLIEVRKEISRLTRLKELNLRSNQLVDLPSSLASLNTLAILDLDDNQWEAEAYRLAGADMGQFMAFLKAKKDAPIRRRAGTTKEYRRTQTRMQMKEVLERMQEANEASSSGSGGSASGSGSGFLVVGAVQQLYHLKGSTRILVRRVDPTVASLNTGDVFILDTGKKIYVWPGPKSNQRERLKGVHYARQMREEAGGGADVVLLDRDSRKQDRTDFFTRLGGTKNQIKDGGSDDAMAVGDHVMMTKMFQIREGEDGRLDMSFVLSVDLSKTMLDSSSCCVLDCGGDVWVWVGTFSSTTERSWAMLKAEELMSRSALRPKSAEILWVLDGVETLYFRENFTDWTDESWDPEVQKARAKAEEQARKEAEREAKMQKRGSSFFTPASPPSQPSSPSTSATEDLDSSVDTDDHADSYSTSREHIPAAAASAPVVGESRSPSLQERMRALEETNKTSAQGKGSYNVEAEIARERDRERELAKEREREKAKEKLRQRQAEKTDQAAERDRGEQARQVAEDKEDKEREARESREKERERAKEKEREKARQRAGQLSPTETERDTLTQSDGLSTKAADKLKEKEAAKQREQDKLKEKERLKEEKEKEKVRQKEAEKEKEREKERIKEEKAKQEKDAASAKQREKEAQKDKEEKEKQDKLREKEMEKEREQERLAKEKATEVAAPEEAKGVETASSASTGSKPGGRRAPTKNVIRARQERAVKEEADAAARKAEAVAAGPSTTETAATPSKGAGVRNTQVGAFGLLYSLGADESMFKKRMEDREARKASSSSAAPSADPTVRLIHVKGRRTCFGRQVEVSYRSLNSGDVFILDCGKATGLIYQWNGAESNRIEKGKAMDIAKSIKDKERVGARVVLVDEGKEPDDFWKVMGGKGEIPSAASAGDDKDAETAIRQYINLHKFVKDDAEPDKLQLQKVEGQRLVKEMLEPTDVYLLDCTAEVYVWTGPSSDLKVRNKALKMGQEIAASRDFWVAPVSRELPGSEQVLFKERFANWGGSLPIAMQQVVVGKNTAKVKQERVDVSIMHRPAHEKEEVYIDDGKGKIQIWRVEEFTKVAIPTEQHGQFYAGDSYLILYTYVMKNKDCYLIYFWQGRNSTTNEKGASALLTMELDDTLKGMAKEVRVVQNKEPKHFLSMFEGRFVVHAGKDPLGKVAKAQGVQADDVAFYDIAGTAPVTTRGIQVRRAAPSLNSCGAYVLVSPTVVYVWLGKAANQHERNFAANISKAFASSRSGARIVELAESSETPAFWDALGGKAPYPCMQMDHRHEPRLFQCSVGTGVFTVDAIPHFVQDDLQTDDMMILDTYDAVYVWQGPLANETERKASMDTAVEYVEKAPDGRPRNSPVLLVKGGAEPYVFTTHFHGWDFSKRAGGSPVTLDSGLTPVQDILALYSKKYTYQELVDKKFPKGIDGSRLEEFLEDSEFEEVFGMALDEFAKMPLWKKQQVKRDLGLY